MCAPCRCVSRSEAPGWVKDTCALSKGALDQMQAQSARLGRERINATLGGQHFGEPQAPVQKVIHVNCGDQGSIERLFGWRFPSDSQENLPIWLRRKKAWLARQKKADIARAEKKSDHRLQKSFLGSLSQPIDRGGVAQFKL